MGNGGAFWTGALTGFVLLGGLSAALSLQTDLPTQTAAERIAGVRSAIEDGVEPTTDQAPSQPVQQQPVTEPSSPVVAEQPAEISDQTAVSDADDGSTTNEPPAVSETVEIASSPDEQPTPSVDPVTPPSPLETPANLENQPSEDTEIALATPEPEPTPLPTPEPTPEPAVAPEPVDEPDEQSSAPLIGENSLPPYKAYANIYRGDASQPLLAIVLTGVGAADDEAGGDMIDELLLMPGPLAIVIAPNAVSPPDVALDIRDAGFEALIGLNEGSFAAGSPNQAAGAAMQNAGEVIGVAVLGEALDDNDIAAGLVDAAEQNGMAILDVTRDGGSVSYRLASAKDLPAAASGRRFDETPSSAMVFQSLERAAFDARRTGAFVVVAEAKPAVLTGLRRWMNVKANKTVTVAPLSAVIDKIVRQ